jgi:hypothetical protein
MTETSNITDIICSCGKTIPIYNDDHHGPTIGICSETGATWETLLTVLCENRAGFTTGSSFRVSMDAFGWNVIAYMRDGTSEEGSAYFTKDDTLTLRVDRYKYRDTEVDIPMSDIVHIQVG